MIDERSSTSNDPRSAPLNLEQEADLLQYLNALLAVKYRIVILAIIIGFTTFGLSKLVDDIYTSGVVLAININENPGGVRQGDYRGSDVVGLIEHDFIIDSVAENEKDRLIARLSSSMFIGIFLEENDLYPYIFSDKWIPETGSWVDDFKPSKVLATKYFKEKMFAARIDSASGLLTIFINTTSAEYSAKLANLYWKRFNEYFKYLESAELQRRRQYLDERISEISNLEMQRSIYRLKETQLAAEALLYGRSSYPLEEIETALPPLNKSYPNRKAWAILAFIGTLFLGITVVILNVVRKNLLNALAQYRNEHARGLRNDGVEAHGHEKKVPHDERDVISPSSETLIQETKKSDRSTLDEWIER